MQSNTGFFRRKAAGFYCTVATVLLSLVGALLFWLLSQASVEATETPALVIGFSAACIVLCIVAAIKDFFKVPTLLAFVSAMIAFGAFAGGRVSYVAFYFSGDVMNTGLSPLFIVSAVCFLLAIVTSVMAICFKQEK